MPSLDVRPTALDVRAIKRDPDTQTRIRLDPSVIELYQTMMTEGATFPPISVWFDGTDYWISDGYHRLVAVENMGQTTIKAIVRSGTLSDARWASLAANSQHGLQRSKEDIRRSVELALVHPRSREVSNMQLSRHLNIPETTLRRLRKELSPPTGEDIRRVAHRGGKTYYIRTNSIGIHSSWKPRKPQSREGLMTDLSRIKPAAPPKVRRILAVINNWIRGTASIEDAVNAVEVIIQETTEAERLRTRAV